MAAIGALLFCADCWAQAKKTMSARRQLVPMTCLACASAVNLVMISVLVARYGSILMPYLVSKPLANSFGVVIVAQAPHSHAAVLLTDYLLGPEAAKILGDLEYGSVFKPVTYKLWYPEAGMSTTQYDKAAERWEKLLREIGKKQS